MKKIASVCLLLSGLASSTPVDFLPLNFEGAALAPDCYLVEPLLKSDDYSVIACPSDFKLYL